ncbi:hypothetical protein EV356DRAFT_497328, partial [Viridothelium virens]
MLLLREISRNKKSLSQPGPGTFYRRLSGSTYELKGTKKTWHMILLQPNQEKPWPRNPSFQANHELSLYLHRGIYPLPSVASNAHLSSSLQQASTLLKSISLPTAYKVTLNPASQTVPVVPPRLSRHRPYAPALSTSKRGQQRRNPHRALLLCQNYRGDLAGAGEAV